MNTMAQAQITCRCLRVDDRRQRQRGEREHEILLQRVVRDASVDLLNGSLPHARGIDGITEEARIANGDQHHEERHQRDDVDAQRIGQPLGQRVDARLERAASVSTQTDNAMPATPLAAPMATIFCSRFIGGNSRDSALGGHRTSVPDAALMARSVLEERPMHEIHGPSHALRGAALTFDADPFEAGAGAMRHESDAVIAMAEGRITHFGAASQVLPQLEPGTPVRSTGSDRLILPGFIDCHVHYPQTQIIGAHGAQLIDWLHKYTFVAEQQFAAPEHAREVAAYSWTNACAPAPPAPRCTAPCIRSRSTRCSTRRRPATCA